MPTSKTKGKRTSAASSINTTAPKKVILTAPKRHSIKSLTVGAGAVTGVETVVYIHGIGNKPVASVVKCQWDRALFNTEMGDRTRMAYWVNREYYPVPEEGTCTSGDLVQVDDDEMPTRSVLALAGEKSGDESRALEREIDALASNAKHKAFLKSVAAKMSAAEIASSAIVKSLELGNAEPIRSGKGAASFSSADVSAKILPLPGFLRKWITRKLTRAFLRDVNDFFFNEERRNYMRQSLIDRLEAGGGPFVVIAHSQGTMVAYDVLRQLTKADCDVRLFVTIGSPLGIQEVQDVFKDWTGGKLSVPPCVSRWVNAADILDPVAADSDISNDFKGTPAIDNFRVINPDSPRHPHSGTGYLKTNAVQDAVRKAVGGSFSQPVARTIIVKDLVEELEDSARSERHSTLIQLSTRPDGDSSRGIDETRLSLESHLLKLLQESDLPPESAQIDHLKRFIACRLTRLELEKLRTEFDFLKIERIWKDASKRALMFQSTNIVQALPAAVGYGAVGHGINWAVLDTGITPSHPHFALHQNLKRQWDCTGRGTPTEVRQKDHDGNGHGTHVAGVIAGQYSIPLMVSNGQSGAFAGMAPKAGIYDFKVLDDRGNGSDSSIIKALDLIADLNEGSGELLIHGVNLSLGGNFDPSVYGCGHTPLCQELRRLWNQGVVVVLAAGNEGYALLLAETGEVPTNMDLSIGDPANLEEAIAVGSINKWNPHTYGVSFFSSRGPTADGRLKPDLVAPGEQILSANSNYVRKPQYANASDLYIEMSGTSMAAPHVSGILAAFLSMRREFIGYPQKVRETLLSNCTDLNRDRYIQGHGMPNLIKMLANT